MASRLLAAAVLALVALSAATKPTWAATTFEVNSSADAVDANPGDGSCDAKAGTEGSQCTLRAAVQEANATVGPDTITLPAGTYTLGITGSDFQDAATGDLDVTDDVIVTGAGVLAAAPPSTAGGSTGCSIFSLVLLDLPCRSRASRSPAAKRPPLSPRISAAASSTLAR